MPSAHNPDRRAVIAGIATTAAFFGHGRRVSAAEMAKGGGYRIIPRDVRDSLGEGITWSARRNAIFWIDILKPTLWSMDVGTGAIRSWPMPETIGWVIERKGRDDFIVGLKRGFAVLRLDPFEITTIGNPEPDYPKNRLNDAKVDRWGRIWAGTLGEAGGSLYRLDPDLRWSRQDTGYKTCNGPTFSLDGRTMYHNDSGRRICYALDLHPDGTLHNKRIFTQFTEEMGAPDGMTTDAQGGIWIAHWGGGRISRFLPDGRFDRAIALPAGRITDMTFAGRKLDRMFVTSASGEPDAKPDSGSLFEVQAGVRGRAPHLFAG